MVEAFSNYGIKDLVCGASFYYGYYSSDGMITQASDYDLTCDKVMWEIVPS